MAAYSSNFQKYMQAAMSTVSMVDRNQQADAANRSAAEQQNLQSEMLWQQEAQRAKQQRDLLQRQLASSRAALAGGGIGFSGGSGQALMQGMARKVEDDIADDYSMTSLQHQARFGSGTKPTAASGLLRGLQNVQQGYQILGTIYNN